MLQSLWGWGSVQTLYIDVYFLINATVNVLALYFASLTARIPATTAKTVISGIIGAVYAVITVFFHSSPVITFFLSVLTLVIMCELMAHRVSLFRRLKLLVFFLIIEMLIGGAVHYAYALLDKYIYDLFPGVSEEAASRNLLLLAVIVLLFMGALRAVVSAFSSSISLKSIRLEIVFDGTAHEIEAMVDTGNMARDPLSGAPVILIKESAARKIFPTSLVLGDMTKIPDCYKTRIRLIPISIGGFSGLLTAVRADTVSVSERKNSSIRATIAIDKEGGTYGGYAALMPSAALENVI